MPDIFERLDGVDQQLVEIKKNSLTKVYPLIGQLLNILIEMSSIARESISNVDAALEKLSEAKSDDS